jgi:hypothetical protein
MRKARTWQWKEQRLENNMDLLCGPQTLPEYLPGV